MAPLTYSGIPQLPFAATGIADRAASSSWVECINSAGPTPQLEPITLRSNSSAQRTKSVGVIPIMERLAVSKVMVAQTGKPVFLPASAAAMTSSLADMVSIHRTSAPPSASASACSVKHATAASWVSVPMGSKSSPVGPMEPATSACRPVFSAWAATARRAKVAAATLSSRTRS